MGKSNTISQQALAEPAMYLDLIVLPKTTIADKLVLDQANSKERNIDVGSVEFVHVNSSTGTLRGSQSVVNQTHYSFQLFIKSFMDWPIFRFDADGASHTNPKNGSLTLKQRQTKTPHYHKFNQEGVEVAYRTEFIEENEPEIQNDINLGVREFCQECTVATYSGKMLFVTRQLDIFPRPPGEDLHYNVNFA